MRLVSLRIGLVAMLCCAVALCSAQTLTIVHTGDTHSCIEPLPLNTADAENADKGGAVRRATLLSQLREEAPDLLLFDTGDFSQGSAYYTLFKGDVEIAFMNAMHYDAAALGNHEFDFGLENLARIVSQAQFPFVCCNIDFTDTPCEGLVKPYTVVERDGHRIGVLGALCRFDGLVAKSCYGDALWLSPAEEAQKAVDKLRGEEGCDFVVALTHIGYSEDGEESDPAFIRETRGIDVVLGGHSHTYWEKAQMFPNADGELVPLDHQGRDGRFLGVLEVSY